MFSLKNGFNKIQSMVISERGSYLTLITLRIETVYIINPKLINSNTNGQPLFRCYSPARVIKTEEHLSGEINLESEQLHQVNISILEGFTPFKRFSEIK